MMCAIPLLVIIFVVRQLVVADYSVHVKKSSIDNFGEVYTVYKTSDDGCNDQIYMEFDIQDALNLNCNEAMCMYCPIMLPDAALDKTPFDHVCLFYQTMGHPPCDGHGGGFGTPHLDFHFNTVSYEELLTYTCGGELPCDVTNPANHLFFVLPPAQNYPAEFYESPTFGSHAIEMMGNHLVRNSEDKYFTAYDKDPQHSINFTSASTTELIDQISSDIRPLWIDCDLQMLQTFTGIEPVLDSGCRIPAWWPPLSPIYATYNGTLVAAELMTPLSALNTQCHHANNSMVQPELEWAWASYFSSYGPVGYFMYSTENRIRIGFQLNDIGENQQCMHREMMQNVHESMVTMSTRNAYFPLLMLLLIITSGYGVVLTAKWLCDKNRVTTRVSYRKA